MSGGKSSVSGGRNGWVVVEADQCGRNPVVLVFLDAYEFVYLEISLSYSQSDCLYTLYY